MQSRELEAARKRAKQEESTKLRNEIVSLQDTVQQQKEVQVNFVLTLSDHRTITTRHAQTERTISSSIGAYIQ